MVRRGLWVRFPRWFPPLVREGRACSRPGVPRRSSGRHVEKDYPSNEVVMDQTPTTKPASIRSGLCLIPNVVEGLLTSPGDAHRGAASARPEGAEPPLKAPASAA